MALELRQNLKLAQKLVMTPQLHQAIKLLQLNRLELKDALQAEIEQNPLLEEAVSLQDKNTNPEALSASESQGPSEELAITTPLSGDGTKAVEEVNWEDYRNTFDADFSFAREAPPADAPSQFDFISSSPGLESHLQWQLTHLQLNELDTELTHCILGNLNAHGFLETTAEDIAESCQCSVEEAEGAIRIVQSLDPPGVAARNIRESLLLQLDHLGYYDKLPYRIIDQHMDLLEKRNYSLIARQTGTTVRRVKQALSIIQDLTPYPGNEFSNEEINYISPDVYVHKVDGEYVIQLNNEGLPHLQISEEYLQMLKQHNTLPRQSPARLSKESRTYLRESKRNAEWFIKSIEQRQRTIYKVVESLLKFQRPFFDEGPAALRPLILRDVADDIGMHESTISRVTSNKYVHTPQGLYELKYFFSSALPTTSGSSVAAEAIKTRISQLISAEDPYKPLSDQALSEKLAEQGIKVARRTIAKYRDQLKILPVKHRRKRKND